MCVRVRMRWAVALALVAASTSNVLAQSVIRGPYLQMSGPTSIVIRWRTDQATDSVATYGTAPETLSQSAASGTARTEHELTLTGLSPETRYYYAVGSSTQQLAGGDETFSFVTSPEVGSVRPARIWVVGDSGTANANARAVRDAYLGYSSGRHTDLWLMLGDNAYPDGTDGQYQAAVFDMYSETLRQTPLWPTLGNHDGHTADSATQSGPYYDIFSLPTAAEAGGIASGTEAYYSFDYGNIHFISLESYETDRSKTGAMMRWLENDLAATDQTWIIAFWHHPPYSKGSHDSDSESALIDMREVALPILDAYGADLVLAGHSHSYERSVMLDGHYGVSSTLAPSMVIDGGDGREDGDGSYAKPGGPGSPNEGAVYAVAGSSGKLSSAPLNHPAMYISLASLGSMVLDVAGGRLDASFLDATGAVRDHFTMTKGADVTRPTLLSSRAVDQSTIALDFSEPLDGASAGAPQNYSMSPHAAITGVTVSANGRNVSLTTAPLNAGTTYTLTISGVEDRAGNAVAPNTVTQVAYVPHISVSFQNGIAPSSAYAGTRDTYISQNNPTVNYGDSSVLLVDGDDPSGSSRDLAILIAWDISTIPSGAVVQSVTMGFDVTNPTGDSYQVYPLLRNWTESGATWVQHAASSSWDSAGASGAGDRAGTAAASVGFNGTGSRMLTLGAGGRAVVQGWIDGSTPNHGFIVASATSSNGMDLRSSQAGGGKPRLTIVYSMPPNPPGLPAPTNLTVAAIGATGAPE